jgi:hypothetical protein
MLIIILKTRLLQFYRILADIGILRLILFLACVLPLLIRYFAEAWYLVAVSSLMMTMVHFLRTDKHFLKIAQLPIFQVYALEYSFLLCPIWFYLAWQNEYIALFSSIIVTFLVAMIPYTSRQNSRPLLFISYWIPAAAFEWRSGFRQSFFFIIVFWGLGLGFSPYELAIPLSIAVLCVVSMCFYLESESTILLRAFQKTPQQLLLHKIKWQILLFGLLISPLTIAFIFFHTNYWYLIIYLFFTSSLAQIFAIFFKYSTYRPHTQTQFNALIYIIFGFIFLVLVLVPFIFPVAIFVLIRYYRKAVENLKIYL